MLNISWFKSKYGKNWGDDLNPILANKLSNKNVQYIDFSNDVEKYLFIGSILSMAGPLTSIYGSGFIHSDDVLSYMPKSIISVRGPLTRNILVKKYGIECPEVYGDPSYLYKDYYKPINTDKKYKLGILPHYIDKKLPFLSKKVDGVKIIDIQGDINTVIDDVNQCESIISSSLHGLIISHMYNIPFKWVVMSNNVYGGDFKFRDWMGSCGFNDNPIFVDKVDVNYSKSTFLPDGFDTTMLKNVCPF